MNEGERIRRVVEVNTGTIEVEYPAVLYHHTLRSLRESILEHGLSRAFSETAVLAREMGEKDWEGYGGIFFTTDPNSADDSVIDCWAVDVRGIALVPDDTTDCPDEDHSWWVTYDDDVIGLDRIRLTSEPGPRPGGPI